MGIYMLLMDVLIVNILVWKDVQIVLMGFASNVILVGFLIPILIHVFQLLMMRNSKYGKNVMTIYILKFAKMENLFLHQIAYPINLVFVFSVNQIMN